MRNWQAVFGECELSHQSVSMNMCKIGLLAPIRYMLNLAAQPST